MKHATNLHFTAREVNTQYRMMGMKHDTNLHFTAREFFSVISKFAQHDRSYFFGKESLDLAAVLHLVPEYPWQ